MPTTRAIPRYAVIAGPERKTFEYNSQWLAAKRVITEREKGNAADLWDTERHVKYDDIAVLQASGEACGDCGGYGTSISKENALDMVKGGCITCHGTGRRG